MIKSIFRINLVLLLFFSVSFSQNIFDKFVTSEKPSTPVDYVDPYIGGISHTLQPTRPTVHLPLSMVRLLPNFSSQIPDIYLASRIESFSINIPSHREPYVSSIMALTGDSKVNEYTGSKFDHDFEKVTPYLYSVLLEDENIIAEYTPAHKAQMFRFQALDDQPVSVLLTFKTNAQIKILDDKTLTGYESFKDMKQYFYMQFDQPMDLQFSNAQAKDDQYAGDEIQIQCVFKNPKSNTVLVRTGISYIDDDQAKENLVKEINHWDFDRLVSDAKAEWNKTLGKISITGGTEDQKVVFYTSLYRCMERMVNINEYGRYYSGFDDKVHKDDRAFYVDDWVWDTYRSLHPLRLLIMPDVEQDMVQSYVTMYEQSGWVPSFPKVYGDYGAMIGHHQAALITDTYFKGFRNFDVKTAYEGLKKNAMEGTMIPWREGPATVLDDHYRSHGYFPAVGSDEEETIPEVHSFERRQAVAVTLEHAHDDWCLSNLAKELNKDDDYKMFQKRGQNYRNLFNPEIGFMAPKDINGNWIQPFDPKMSGGIGGRLFYAEMNSYTYTWYVPQDIEGLTELLGGKDAFVNKLDAMFEEGFGRIKWRHFAQFPDATGMVGQFSMGNEQSFHIPYLYSAQGVAWKSQKRIRQLMDQWFRNDLMGVSGDEDGGGLSSFYVFSALGFYPVCAGNPVYYIGTPLFKTATLDMGNGKKLELVANNVSDQNKYIQSMKLNGKTWNKAWFRQKDIQDGGKIVFEMGPRPNKNWGTN